MAISHPKSGVGRPPLASTKSRIVKVLVGRAEEEFNLHEDLLCHYSYIFERMLRGSFKEASEGVVILEKENPRIFKSFVSFIYFGRLHEDTIQELRPVRKLFESSRRFDHDGSWLCDLWAFAERLGIPDLQDIAMDELQLWAAEVDYEHLDPLIRVAYSATVPESNLRKVLAEFAVKSGRKCSPKMPPEFLSDVITKLHEVIATKSLRSTVQSAKRKFPTCEYHVHHENVHCVNETPLRHPVKRSSPNNST